MCGKYKFPDVILNFRSLWWAHMGLVAALIRGSDFQILADVDLSRFQIADNLLLRHMTQ